MLAGSKRNTNVGLGLGILLFLIGGGLLKGDPGEAVTALPGVLCVLIGFGLFIWGCCANAKGKGYPTVLGLIGILGLIGFIVLALLPDKYKCCERNGPNCTHGEPRRSAGDRSTRAA